MARQFHHNASRELFSYTACTDRQTNRQTDRHTHEVVGNNKAGIYNA